MKRVYIAHPLNGDGSEEWGDLDKNLERYLRFVAMASNLGHAVISWVAHPMLSVRGFCPKGHEWPMQRCRALVEVADEFWVAGPPEVSSGTREELEHALEHGIEIVQKQEWMNPHYMPPVGAHGEPMLHVKWDSLQVQRIKPPAPDEILWVSAEECNGEDLEALREEIHAGLEEVDRKDTGYVLISNFGADVGLLSRQEAEVLKAQIEMFLDMDIPHAPQASLDKAP